MIYATCVTIAQILASVSGGEIVRLQGDCGPIVINRSYSPQLIIRATGASARGLVITGSGIHWHGGTFRASGGMDAVGSTGYAVSIRNAKSVTIDGATITEAKKGIVPDHSRTITLTNLHFIGLREDGVIANEVQGLSITHSKFEQFRARPTSCVIETSNSEGLSKRACLERAGTWTDGNHSDAIQFRNRVTDAVFSWNDIVSPQGIGQFDARTDLPCERIRIEGNIIATSAYHSITLNDCRQCIVINNHVSSSDPSRKTVLRLGIQPVLACGNSGKNGGPGLEPCKQTEEY